MPTKNEKFDLVALNICRKPKGVTPENCYLAQGTYSLICRNYKKCRIWEKSDEQLDYILHDFNTSSFLLACAGSGKTEVVGFKAAYEISLWKKFLGGIAVLTFTNNAASIIQERVSQVVGASIGYPHFIGTFDSWLHRYVANPFVHLITGYQGREGDHSLRLVEDRVDAAFLNAFKTTYQYFKTDHINANEFYYLDLIRQEIAFSSSNANNDRTRNQASLEDWQKKDLLNTKEKFWKAGFVTYQDVEHLCYFLLNNHKNASCLISRRFPVIVIDECQDLAWPQLQILQKLLDNGTVIHFVGDLNQAIYSFRRVDPEKVEHFAANNKFSRLQLTHNFRSLQPIVTLNSKLVTQSNIVGENYYGDEPTCVCLIYKKNEIQKLPDSFIRFLENKFDLDKCAIITRNNNTVAKLRPGVSSKVTKSMLPAIAIHIWKLPNISIEQRREALSSLGTFVASAYFPNQSHDSNNQSCPEEIRSKIKWRMFLLDILEQCCGNSQLSNLESTWKDWAKAFRETLNDIISTCCCKNEITIDAGQAEKYIAPRGVSDKKVSSTTETIHFNPSQPIRITNFHQIKGETLEAVMVVSSPTNQGSGEGYWNNWLTDPTSENARFAYVASTRPKNLLVWAVPDHLDQTDIDKLQNLGFIVTNTL